MGNVSLPIIDRINAIYGAVVIFLTYLFGTHWELFAGFLFLNIVDYITGWGKSKLNGKLNSMKGATGALKKVGYWFLIAVSFSMSVIFIEIGNTIGVDLRITSGLGWFVLSTLIVNECRSILENFVEAGYEVPSFLINGLEIANKAIDGTLKINSTNGKIETDIPIDEIENGEQVTLQVKITENKKPEE